MKSIPFLIIIMIGFLQGFSISFILLSPLLIFSYYFFIKKIIDEQSTKKIFYIGWCFGSGFFLGSMHWIVSPFLIYEKHFFFSPFVLIIFPFLMGIFFSINSILISEFRKKFDLKDKNSIFIKSFFISLFFFFTEFLRSHIFGGLPLNLTAHIWAFHSEFIQIAKFFGVFGLSFLTINWVVLVALNILLKKRKTAFFIFLLLPFFLLVTDKFSKFEIGEDKNLMEISVRVVQPNIPQIEKWNRLLFQENLEKLIGLTLINNKPDEKKIVIWPEVAVTSYFNEEQELAQYLRQKIPPNIILITGSLRREFTKNNYNVFNSFYILKKNGQSIYDKKKLVPFGEFIPLKEILTFAKLTPGVGEFNVGKKPNYIEFKFKEEKIIIEPSICYEAIFQTFGTNNSNLFVNITNDAWFGKTIGPRQHLAAQIFRSVEKGVPLIRSSNSGISVITDLNGKIIKRIDLNKKGYIEKNITFLSNETFFEKTKNKSILLLLFFLILIFYLIDKVISFKRNQVN